MGGLESRFNGLLVEGDTKGEEALEMWKSNAELQANFKPNAPIKSSPVRDTPLHCAARFELRDLLKEFLSNGGDPFVRNYNQETPLHIVCSSAKFSSRRSKRKAELLQLLLERIPEKDKDEEYSSFEDISSANSLENGHMGSSNGRSVSLISSWALSSFKSRVGVGDRSSSTSKNDNGGNEHNLGILDKSCNTPLHLAAVSGLLDCVELLVAHGAPLFCRNIAGQTPCDAAWEAKQLIIAKQLESKMFFANSTEDEVSTKPIMRDRNRSFHDTHTLKKLKQAIIESVAETLQIPEFPAQALLMAYGWSEKLVSDAWKEDREAACEKAGIDMNTVVASPGERRGDVSPYTSLTVHKCGICWDEIAPIARVHIPCDHNFCQTCWESYLEGQINEGAGMEIRCPEYQCYKLVPEDIIAKLITKDQLEKYSDLNIKQFVDSSADIRWCPFPDCGYAICIKKKQVGVASGSKGGGVVNEEGATGGVEGQPGLNVECGRGHGFCWHCMKEPHEPSCCELWEKWKEIISHMISDEETRKVATEAKANAKWILRNTKPCPNCSSPIQKSEGCNHMTCRKCRYDFCWVCLDPWNVHNHRTGGYFTCNRFKAQEKANEKVKKARKNMEDEYVKRATQDLEIQTKRFDHYYQRYINHLDSLAIEMKLLQDSGIKTRELAKLGHALDKKVARVKAKTSSISTDSDSSYSPSVTHKTTTDGERVPVHKTNFLDNVFRVLLYARRILAASYCIGYFIPEDNKGALNAHEVLQAKLEEAVEVLSEMVNRQYLQTPQSQMGEAARNVDFLCDEYLTEMKEVAIVAYNGLVANEKRKQMENEAPPIPPRANRDPAHPMERPRADTPIEVPDNDMLRSIENAVMFIDPVTGRLHIYVGEGVAVPIDMLFRRQGDDI